MNYTIVHSLIAEKELLKAAKWYNSQQEGLGENFLDEFENLEYYIGLNPMMFPDKNKKFRRAVMKRFPFVVLFKVEGNMIYVFSVFNCYQNPKKKKEKLK